jgi:cyanophycin synthetase
LDTVPAADQRVVLADTANLSTGGTAIDRTDDIHPDNASAARRAALAVGLDSAGIALVIPDIARSWREVGGGIVEVNAAPGFRMHVQPSQGKSRPVGEAVVSMLFPPGTPSHVPVAVITGTNGKSTTVRMLAHILRHAGRAPGFTSTSGVFVDNQCLWKGDASGPQSARMLLANPAIDCAVLEAARGGILRAGLGVPHCDVGAVLNVSADHLGLGGIATIDDLAAVKSVVVESVARHGISVLNADDPRTAAMAAHAGGSVCFFSTAPQRHGFLQRHIEQDGRAVCLEGEGDTAQIVAHHGDRRSRVMAVNDIPAVYNGAAAFNVQNALAATAVAHAMGVDYTQIREALALFTSSFEQNPGRFNVHDDHGFRIVMDYAHNPAALEALFAVVRSMRARHGRIIGHVSTPGDRRDDDIREVGAIAARELDVVVFRELPDNRGRKAGEVVRLLAEGARQAGYGSKHIICVRGEDEATDVCLRAARPGDLVILTPSDIDGIWRQVLAFQPQSARQAGASSFAAT